MLVSGQFCVRGPRSNLSTCVPAGLKTLGVGDSPDDFILAQSYKPTLIHVLFVVVSSIYFYIMRRLSGNLVNLTYLDLI